MYDVNVMDVTSRPTASVDHVFYTHACVCVCSCGKIVLSWLLGLVTQTALQHHVIPADFIVSYKRLQARHFFAGKNERCLQMLRFCGLILFIDDGSLRKVDRHEGITVVGGHT